MQPAAPGEGAPAPQMVEAARLILRVATAEQTEQMRFAVDAVEWQTWANPEFMQFDTGVRLENMSEALREAVLGLIAVTLSEEGYTQARTLMRINGFLGDIVELPALMNEYSYNFALYGEPSLDAPWGWQLFGHHLAMNALVVGDQLVVTRVFFGAEPDIIDEGPFAGSTVFDQRITLARRLMQSLPAAQRDRARTFDEIVDPAMPPGRIHPGDERHLAGAFQDNRVIPYEGICGSELNGPARNLLSDLIGEFLAYLPPGPAAARRREVDAHLEQTWFSWIGGYEPDEPFYLRAQSPVIIVELDHHCGVFPSNTTPAPFHIHTVVRTPNGNDYGRALVRAYDSRS